MATDDIRQADMAATKYLFELSFDEDGRAANEPDAELDGEPDVPPPPPEPTFSEEELNAARTQAFQEGQDAGRNEAGAGIEQRASVALETLAAGIGALHGEQETHNRLALKDLIALNARILEMLVPAYVERHATEEIETLVTDCLSRVIDPGQIVVEVPTDMAEVLAGRLQETAARAGFTGTMEIRATPELSGADVKLSWQNGGASRVTDELWAEISDAIARTIHSLDPDGNGDIEPAASVDGIDAEPVSAPPPEETATPAAEAETIEPPEAQETEPDAADAAADETPPRPPQADADEASTVLEQG